MSSSSPSAAQLWWRVVPAFAAGYFVSYGLRTVNAVIAPELSRDFATSAAELGLLTSAYFLAFGLFQLPLGLLLDRFGPRRVEAALLLIAAAGCAVFALARGVDGLILGRALIGLGVSACLMASFKAFSQWFPIESLPSLTGVVMFAGGLGAVATSVPVELALPLIGWRGVFLLVAGLAAAVALLLWFTVPDKPPSHAESFAEQLAAFGRIFLHRSYWRFAPQGCLIIGGFMAIQGLWAVPWMISVNGLSRSAAAEVLFLMALAMLCGFLFVALAAVPLARRGLPPIRLLAGGMALALLVEFALLAELAPPWLLWSLLGFSFSLGNLGYSQLASRFPVQLSGRVNTALNLITFAGAFSLQWGIGAAVDGVAAFGFERREAFRISFGLLLVLQTIAFLWFLRRDRPQAAAHGLPAVADGAAADPLRR